MKKMMRTAAVLAAMVLALVLSACSNSAGDDRGNGSVSGGTGNGGASGGGIGGGSNTGSDNALTVSYAADLVGTWKVTGDSVFIETPNGAANADSKDPSVVAKSFDDWMYTQAPYDQDGYNGGKKLFDENYCVTFSTQNEAKEFIDRMNFLVGFINSDIEEFANIMIGGKDPDPELTKFIIDNAEYETEGYCVINSRKDKIEAYFYQHLYCEAPNGGVPLKMNADVKITLEKQSTEK